jgi:Protein of unknown function (DUF3810)
MVKPKSVVLRFFSARSWRRSGWILPVFSFLTFIFSWAAVYPSEGVERWYARGIFPKISYVVGKFADSVPFSWLDVALPSLGLLLVVLGRKRRWGILLNMAAGFYLFFFWTWGLNYHRKPLNSKLQLDSARMQPQGMTEFARHAATQLNRLYNLSRERQNYYDELGTQAEAARRVRRVVAIIDNSDWESAHRVKVSWVGNPWLRTAGVDGVFNPLGHEPVVSKTVLDVERPFVMSHELAHVRGYPDEGDANVIAMFATLMSENPAFQYSGWLSLWLYLRTPDLEKLLDTGPRHDIERIFERARAEQVRWVNDFQEVLLDWFLKANSIDEGVRSYSRVVLLASGTEPFWDRFR